MTEGLVCAFSTLEPCRSFTVAGNRETKRLEVVRHPRQCLVARAPDNHGRGAGDRPVGR